MTLPGAERPKIQELPRARDRISFVYLDMCTVGRSNSALTVTDSRGTTSIPIANVCTVLLGPGTCITHRAMELLGDAGTSAVWVGENGVKYYAHGKPLTHSSTLLMAQAKAVSNTRSRLAVARTMYQMRFPGEDVSRLTMQQLRGREGSRVRSAYRRMSEETGVEWNGRNYTPGESRGSDTVNLSLSMANSCLYGVVHGVIVSMGCSPGLGFVHTGHERSFVYDIADLYKTEISVPTAFRIASERTANIESATRRAVRDMVFKTHLMERVASDIRYLLLGPDHRCDDEQEEEEDVRLWDDKTGSVDAATSYRDDSEHQGRQP